MEWKWMERRPLRMINEDDYGNDLNASQDQKAF